MASKGIFLTPTLSCYGISQFSRDSSRAFPDKAIICTVERPPYEDFLPESGKDRSWLRASTLSRWLKLRVSPCASECAVVSNYSGHRLSRNRISGTDLLTSMQALQTEEVLSFPNDLVSYLNHLDSSRCARQYCHHLRFSGTRP